MHCLAHGTLWYVIGHPDPLPVSHEEVGSDLGVTHFAALSTGEFIESPRHYRKAEKKPKKLQEVLSRKKRGSHRRARAVRRIARAHRKVCNQRRDFIHKAARHIVNRFQLIVVEDLKTAYLVKRPAPKRDEETGQYLPNGTSAKAGLNKSIADAGWSRFTTLLESKAAWAGRTVVKVSPDYTSQTCPNCGTVRKKTLDERWHSCTCGAAMDRDTASGKIILVLGRKQLLVGTRPTA